MKYSKIEIARYNSAMRGTGMQYTQQNYLLFTLHLFCILGGGPEYIWKNVLFKDIYEKVIGVGNPSIPGGQIEVRYSDTAIYIYARLHNYLFREDWTQK